MPKDSFEKLQVDGAQIAYRRIGNGRPLVVLNGFAATSADWDPSFIDRLASSNQLILLDDRGIGHSTDKGRPFDIAQLADDVQRVVEAFGIKRAGVLGWSMGGFIAQTLALQRPGLINKLILLSTAPGGPTQIAPRLKCGRNSSMCQERPMSRRVAYYHYFSQRYGRICLSQIRRCPSSSACAVVSRSH